jgi:hypothetical protein
MCWSCWREAKANETMPPPPPKIVRVEVPVETVSEEVLRQAIRLCHPDAHPIERFEQANAVTAALLAALDRLKGAA